MNKRLQAAVVWLLILLLFCGCHPKESLPDLGAPFASTVTVTAEGLTLHGSFTRQLIGCYTFRVLWPTDLENLTFFGCNGQVTVSLGQMSGEFSQPFPVSSFFGAVTQALDHLARQEVPERCPVQDGYLGFAGQCQAGDYVVVYHAKTKQPATVKIGNGLLVEFTYDSAEPESLQPVV